MDISQNPTIREAIDDPTAANKEKAQDLMIQVMRHHPEFLVFYYFDDKGIIQFGISAPDKRISGVEISSRQRGRKTDQRHPIRRTKRHRRH